MWYWGLLRDMHDDKVNDMVWNPGYPFLATSWMNTKIFFQKLKQNCILSVKGDTSLHFNWHKTQLHHDRFQWVSLTISQRENEKCPVPRCPCRYSLRNVSLWRRLWFLCGEGLRHMAKISENTDNPSRRLITIPTAAAAAVNHPLEGSLVLTHTSKKDGYYLTAVHLF